LIIKWWRDEIAKTDNGKLIIDNEIGSSGSKKLILYGKKGIPPTPFEFIYIE
jgi:hypothetical protein